MAIGDLDVDGNPDLAVANHFDNNVSVLLGNGDGTFQETVNFGVGDGPRSIAIDDLDGDGNPDLAVANYYDDNVSVLLGNGDGTFQVRVNYGVGDKPHSVAIGDLDGDSIPDLAVANYDDDNVSVLRGNGDGTFYYPFPATYGAGDGPCSVAIDDLDGDGNADLAVACQGSSPTYIGVVSILLGTGDGTFQTAVNYESGDRSISVAIGDLDNDGKPDLAAANFESDSVSVMLGNGDGTFQAPVNFGVDWGPQSVAIDDFDGDGDLDLAVADWSVSVLLGNGDGTFQAAVNYGVWGGASSVAIDDLDGDGNPDLAVANFITQNVSVLLGTGDGTFPTADNYGVGEYPLSVVIADLDGDGNPDLAVANFYTQNVSVLLGNGDGTFQTAVNYEAGDGPDSMAIGDLDGDSYPDLVVVNNNSGEISVLLGNGDGTFQDAINYTLYEETGTVTIGDLNGDGNQDLVVSTYFYDFELAYVSILLGSGDGTFQLDEYYEVGDNGVMSIAIGDLNGDGNPDLTAAHGFSDYTGWGYVSVLLGNGDGTFQEPIYYETGDSPSSVAIGDLDGDGYPDLAVASEELWQEEGNVFVMKGNGDGTFQGPVNYGVGIDPLSLVIGDLDRDNNPDLVVANDHSNNVSVLLGSGGGAFQDAVNYGADGWPHSVAIGDLDGNGYPDLAVANSNSNNVSVLINTTEPITVSAEMTCVPSEGTLPFNAHFNVTLTNEYTGFDRVIDGRISVALAGGQFIPNWKRGSVTLSAGDSFVIGFNQMMPGMAAVVGTNTFTLLAEDTTPSPYNQPPYPPSGDTDTDSCVVTGIAP